MLYILPMITAGNFAHRWRYATRVDFSGSSSSGFNNNLVVCTPNKTCRAKLCCVKLRKLITYRDARKHPVVKG